MLVELMEVLDIVREHCDAVAARDKAAVQQNPPGYRSEYWQGASEKLVKLLNALNHHDFAPRTRSGVAIDEAVPAEPGPVTLTLGEVELVEHPMMRLLHRQVNITDLLLNIQLLLLERVVDTVSLEELYTPTKEGEKHGEQE